MTRWTGVNTDLQWEPAIRPTRAEINLSSVLFNARALFEKSGSGLMAVVKADAYGHGAISVAMALEDESCVSGFGVSLVEEGLELRKAGVRKRILIMGPSLASAYDEIVRNDLIPLVSDTQHLAPLCASAIKQGRRLKLHLKFDTGMNRLGFRPEEALEVLAKIDGLDGIRIAGIASHLACADIDMPDDMDSMTRRQIRHFASLAEELKPLLSNSVEFHLANSAGILSFPETSYDLVRPGIALYGNGSQQPLKELPQGLSQALKLCSQVTQIRKVTKGSSVSYGARWVASQDSTVAIVPIGYADGLPRNLSGHGMALLGGRKCAIIGVVSMDMVVVDVTDAPGISVGTEAVFIGKQGDLEISVAEIAQQCGISEYEVSCGISKRVPRRYILDTDVKP